MLTTNHTNKDKMYFCLVNFNLEAAIELMRKAFEEGFHMGMEITKTLPEELIEDRLLLRKKMDKEFKRLLKRRD